MNEYVYAVVDDKGTIIAQCPLLTDALLMIEALFDKYPQDDKDIIFYTIARQVKK